MSTSTSSGARRKVVLATVLGLVAGLLLPVAVLVSRAAAATSPALTRYPYLTDSVQSSITVNWATDTSATTASVTWGAPGSCGAHTQAATRTSITVVSKAEYQWKATIPVTPDTTYCYRVLLAGTDLLGSDPSPTFTSQVAAGSTAPFSFDVFGDWGQAYANGNPDQANVMSRMAASGARFAVMTGDTSYPSGSQTTYGDLQQAGANVSTVFGPGFWTVPGRSLPVFNTTGNHGFTNGNVQVVNWPEGNAAASSGGRYLMESYPSVNGTTVHNYPSMWYAFDAGNARFYILTAAWADGNIGTASVYQDDHDQHWTTSSAEYTWLKADLAAHPNAVKFAFWHYPLYADSSSQPSDTFLQGGPGTLQGLLDQNKVAVVFNGHAHGYERNKPDSAGMVSYVLGNGGAALGSVSGCSSYDAYAIGSGGSHCGAAPAGLSNDHVYGFAKVTVDGRQVTVTPTDEMGRTFDVQTYNFGTGTSDFSISAAPSSVSVTAGQSTTTTISTAVTSGSAQSVTLSASGQPAGTTVTFNPATVTAGQSSTMTLATSSSTPTGTASVVVTGTGTSATHTTTVTLSVTGPVVDDFSISAAPSSVSVTAGQSTTATISTAVTSGSAQSVTLSASGQPAGTTVTFNPATVTAGQSSTMTLATSSSTPTGTTSVVVTGTGTSATHTTTVTLTVTAPSAGPQLVQSAAGTASATTTALTATFGAPTVTGHLLVVTASVYTGATNQITAVTDSAGDTWTRAGAYFVSGHNSDGELWFTVATAPSTTVTVKTASAASMVFEAKEFSGVVATNPLDTSAGASNTGTSADSGTLTPAAPHDLLIGFAAGHGNTETMTIGTAGYTVSPQQTTTGTVVTVRTGYQALSSTAAVGITATFPTAMYWAAGVATFRAQVDQP